MVWEDHPAGVDDATETAPFEERRTNHYMYVCHIKVITHWKYLYPLPHGAHYYCYYVLVVFAGRIIPSCWVRIRHKDLFTTPWVQSLKFLLIPRRTPPATLLSGNTVRTQSANFDCTFLGRTKRRTTRLTPGRKLWHTKNYTGFKKL